MFSPKVNENLAVCLAHVIAERHKLIIQLYLADKKTDAKALFFDPLSSRTH
jgi:hypothetical protein